MGDLFRISSDMFECRLFYKDTVDALNPNV